MGVAEVGVVGDELDTKREDPAARGGVRVNMGLVSFLPRPPLLCDRFLEAGYSAEDSVIGEKPRYVRVPVDMAAGEGDGEGEGVGVQRSESPDACPPSSRVVARKGSNFGKLTASSALCNAM